jgi:hypothetical protein
MQMLGDADVRYANAQDNTVFAWDDNSKVYSGLMFEQQFLLTHPRVYRKLCGRLYYELGEKKEAPEKPRAAFKKADLKPGEEPSLADQVLSQTSELDEKLRLLTRSHGFSTVVQTLKGEYSQTACDERRAAAPPPAAGAEPAPAEGSVESIMASFDKISAGGTPESGPRKMYDLRLGWGSIKSSEFPELVQAFKGADRLLVLDAMTTVQLHRNDLGDEAMAGIAELLALLPNLEVLDLSQNKLGNLGLQGLVVALARGACPKLKEVKLVDNDGIGEQGSVMIGGVKVMRKELVWSL